MSERVVKILWETFPKLMISGLKVTIPLTVLAFALSMVLAMFLAIAQVANIKGLRQFSRFYIWIFRGTPLLVQLYIIFFGLPKMGIMLPAFPAAILAFGMNYAAYNAEIIRAAMQAVPQGQTEAAYLIGMNYPQILCRVIIPQAFPISFPSLFNNLISLVKDTSLAASITVIEMFTTAQQVAARTFETLAIYCEVAVTYLIFCTLLTWLQRAIEKRMGWKTKPEKLAILRKRLGEVEE